MRYKIILNATTLPKGGGIQACVSFIHKSLDLSKNIDWVYIVSDKVAGELQKFGTVIPNYRLIIFNESPAKNVDSRKRLLKLSEDLAPDAIFTFFGPAYVKFKRPHLCGVADGWVTHSTRLAYQSLDSITSKILTFMRCLYKGYWYRYADQWVVEADCAKKGMVRRIRVPEESVHVVKNTCATHYTEKVNKPYLFNTGKHTKILTLSSYYPHKNLNIIPYIAQQLKKMGYDDFQFIITIAKETPEDYHIIELCKQLGVVDCVNNIGPVNIIDGPALYAAVDIVLQPSLLETFSANYPEAMAQKKPIVTTDLDFAHDICEDAALYYPPDDAKSAAECIDKLINNDDLVNNLTQNGRKILEKLPTSMDKYYAYESILINMAKIL
ncbi:MAG: glycosyltransferase [Gammaproteobacteria bacterium]|nr:glycosyltransferase [Gammaproteobacteria bacterium]